MIHMCRPTIRRSCSGTGQPRTMQQSTWNRRRLLRLGKINGKFRVNQVLWGQHTDCHYFIDLNKIYSSPLAFLHIGQAIWMMIACAVHCTKLQLKFVCCECLSSWGPRASSYLRGTDALSWPLLILRSQWVHAWPKITQLEQPSQMLSLIHIWRCRRSTLCRSRWSPYH